MPERETPLQKLLKEKGPLDSQGLSEAIIQRKLAANGPAARKMIERSKRAGEIESTYPVRFDKSYLYYLKAHRGRKYATCIKKLLPQKPAFHRVFKTLLANKGWITIGQIGKASACLPAGDTSKAGGRQTLDTITSHLLDLGLIDEVGGETGLYRIGKQFGTDGIRRAAFRKKLELESELLNVFRDWLRKCFLVAYDSHTVRSDDISASEFNQTFFDLHGPVYFGPFSQARPLRRSSSHGNFLLAEILGYRKFTIVDTESTLERVASIGHRWKSLSLCPIVLAPSYSQSAWRQLRSAGVIALTFKDVFGRNIEELMRRFWRAIAVEEATPDSLDEIEGSLELAKGTIVSGGLIGNLKGALFELLVALAFRAEGYDTTLQKIVRKLDENEEYEIDVVAVRGDATCKLVECKGRKSTYSECREDVERHFFNRCRAAADAYGWNVTDLYNTVEAMYVTSGKLDADAASYADSTKMSHGIHCSVMEREDLLRFLKEMGQSRLVDIIKTYY